MAVRVPNEQRQHNHLGFRIDDGGDVDDFGLMCRNRAMHPQLAGSRFQPIASPDKIFKKKALRRTMQRPYNCHTLLWQAVKALLYTLAAVMRMRGPAMNHDHTTNLCLLHWHHTSDACIHAHAHAHKILHTRTRLHPH